MRVQVVEVPTEQFSMRHLANALHDFRCFQNLDAKEDEVKSADFVCIKLQAA